MRGEFGSVQLRPCTLHAPSSTVHRRLTRKSVVPYSVFDEPRVLQTALQSLHDALRPGRRIARVQKVLILRDFLTLARGSPEPSRGGRFWVLSLYVPNAA